MAKKLAKNPQDTVSERGLLFKPGDFVLYGNSSDECKELNLKYGIEHLRGQRDGIITSNPHTTSGIVGHYTIYDRGNDLIIKVPLGYPIVEDQSPEIYND